jgi:hypothetical protein
LSRCQRYYANTVDEGEDPRNQLGEHTGFQMVTNAAVTGNDDVLDGFWQFPRTMRKKPDVLKIYNTVNDVDDTWYDQRTGNDIDQGDIDETITTKFVNFSLEDSLTNRVMRAHLEVEAEF